MIDSVESEIVDVSLVTSREDVYISQSILRNCRIGGGAVSYILNCSIFQVEMDLPDRTVLEELFWWRDVP